MELSFTVLVTGGAGYIGSHCVAKLCNAGFEVIVIDNLSEGHKEAVHPLATFYQADISDTLRVLEILKRHSVTAVIHFAACALVGESMRDPGKYFQNNVSAGISLLQAMKTANVQRIIFSSSCATYGAPEGTGEITESTPQNPINPYGESKLIFEKIINWYQNAHGFKSTIFRYFNAAGADYGLGEDHRIETHLIPKILKVALGQNDKVSIYGLDFPTADGSALRDYIHVSDLVDAHYQALLCGTTGSFNLGTGTPSSVLEVIEACRAVTGKDIPIVPRQRRQGDPAALYSSPRLALQAFDWAPSRNLNQCIKDAWEWHRSNPCGFSIPTGGSGASSRKA